VDEAKPTTSSTRVISVGGGKGGVGKSIVATNLAVAIAQAGHEVVLCDLDLGAANLHLMLGLSRPRPGIVTLLSPDGDLETALTDTGIPRLRLLAGTGGTVGSANLPHAQKLRIIRKLKGLKCDVVVVDVGAGVGYNALDFFELGQQRIIVATPQVTSVHDAYAFLKGAVLRTLRHHASRKTEAWMLDPALASKDGEKVKDLLLRIHEQDPAFGAKVVHILKHFGAYLVGNHVNEASQVGVFQAVSRMVEDFLGIDLPILGCVPANTRLADSVNQRKPVMARQSQSATREAKVFREMVEALLAGDMAPEEELLLELIEESEAPAAAPMPPPPPPPRASGNGAVPPPPPPPRASGNGAVPPPPPPAKAATSGEPEDLPAPVKPRVYVRPSRKRRVDPEDKKRKRALDAQGKRRRLTLPGMPPSRPRAKP